MDTVNYKGVRYVLAGGIMKTTVHGLDKAWGWAKSQIEKGKVVVWDVMEGEDVFPMYAGPNTKVVIDFHVKGGKDRSYKDLREIRSKDDLDFDKVQASVKSAALRGDDEEESNPKVKELNRKSKLIDNVSMYLMGGIKTTDYGVALRAFKEAKSVSAFSDKALLKELESYFADWKAHIDEDESLDERTDKLRDKLDTLNAGIDREIERVKKEATKSLKKRMLKNIKPKDMPF